MLKQFDEIIGIDRLYAIHINDSKNPFESHKDRHEKIGEGSIGTEAFERIINHPMLADKPFFLETPNELDGYAKEIALLKSCAGSKNGKIKRRKHRQKMTSHFLPGAFLSG